MLLGNPKSQNPRDFGIFDEKLLGFSGILSIFFLKFDNILVKFQEFLIHFLIISKFQSKLTTNVHFYATKTSWNCCNMPYLIKNEISVDLQPLLLANLEKFFTKNPKIPKIPGFFKKLGIFSWDFSHFDLGNPNNTWWK